MRSTHDKTYQPPERRIHPEKSGDPFSSSEFVEILAAFCTAFQVFLWYSLHGRNISSIDLFFAGVPQKGARDKSRTEIILVEGTRKHKPEHIRERPMNKDFWRYVAGTLFTLA